MDTRTLMFLTRHDVKSNKTAVKNLQLVLQTRLDKCEDAISHILSEAKESIQGRNYSVRVPDMPLIDCPPVPKIAIDSIRFDSQQNARIAEIEKTAKYCQYYDLGKFNRASDILNLKSSPRQPGFGASKTNLGILTSGCAVRINDGIAASVDQSSGQSGITPDFSRVGSHRTLVNVIERPRLRPIHEDGAPPKTSGWRASNDPRCVATSVSHSSAGLK